MKKLFIRILTVILAAFLCSCAAGCGRKTEFTRTYYEYFDTVTVIYGYAASAREFETVCSAAEAVLREYNRLADIYREYSGMNNLKTVNDCAGTAPVPVDAKLMDLVEYALALGKESGGALNCAMGAVLSIWHDCRSAALDGGSAAVPSAEELEKAAQHCSAEDVILDRGTGTVFLRDAGMSLDLGAVAKGYAAERAAEAALEAGGEGCVLDVGGNIRVLGAKPGGKPWIAGVQDPFSAQRNYTELISMTGGALATSGDYQRFYEVNGVKYHHIIDPVTLFPSVRYSSVTVLAADAGLADALSTALFNLDPDAGEALAAKFGAEAYWITPDGETHMTAGFGEFTQ